MDTELLSGLNEAQREAVTYHEGPLLMLAGPGSGKTRVITHRIAHMLERGIDAKNILALTFTNKSAGEMRERLTRLVGPHDVWMGTFHGFCVRMLRRYARIVGLPENFNIYDTDDSLAALKAAVQVSKFELTHVSVATLANRISFFKNRLITPDALEGESLSSEEFQVSQVYPFYQRELLKNGAVDFDDLLMHTALLLRSHPDLRQAFDEQFRYVMVDEYQDTNLAQYVIVRHLSVDYPNLAVTGDPDQSIYGWRGANIKNILHLERDFPELHIIRLQENYRSTPEILSIADALIQNNEHRKEKTLIPSRESGPSVRLAIYPTARSEAEDIALQISAMVQESGYNYNDFGILYRTNAHSRQIEQALLRHQIPNQLIGGYRFFSRREIKDILSYLLLIHNPSDDIAFHRAINTPTRGIGKKTLEKLQEFATSQQTSLLEACRMLLNADFPGSRSIAGISARARKAIREFLKIFDSLLTLAHGSLLDLLLATIDMIDYRAYLQKQNDIDETEATANLDELLAEAKELDAETMDDRSSLERFLESSALQADTDKLDSDSQAVTLMTLHAAKGLEFPNVFVIAVEENVLPHARSKDDPLSLEEERRLLFVGITRAENRLQLSYAKSRGFSNQGSGVASSFLMELPRHEMELIDNTEVPFYDDSQAGFDDQFENSRVEWDDLSQVDPHEIDDGGVEFDDMCQLPPEELASKQAIMQRLKRQKNALRSAADMPGSQFAAAHAKFKIGVSVLHQRFGEGEIVNSEGRGPKQSVTIQFSNDQSIRTFRLSHVLSKLSIP